MTGHSRLVSEKGPGSELARSFGGMCHDVSDGQNLRTGGGTVLTGRVAVTCQTEDI